MNIEQENVIFGMLSERNSVIITYSNTINILKKQLEEKDIIIENLQKLVGEKSETLEVEQKEVGDQKE